MLSIECSRERIKQGLKNQEKHYPNALGQVVFVEHYIDDSSTDFIEKSIEKHFTYSDTESSCIVGLHACADLSITILKLFMEMSFCKGLVIMPCCYHRLKMNQTDVEFDSFENFPLSSIYKHIFMEYDAKLFLRRPFLRLACQQTIGNFISMTVEEHERHARNFMYRAILEDVVVKGK